MARRPFVAGNWKMNCTLEDARELMSGLRNLVQSGTSIDIAVCTPFTLLYPMGKELDGTDIKLGAQNCYFEKKGAFTGEISPGMLSAAKVTYVIIGHSERRHVFGETGDQLRSKVKSCLEEGLSVIYCVGELLEERDAGKTTDVVGRQLAEGLGDDMDPAKLTIAYEPVWAIGTGRTASPDQAQEVHAFIRERMAGLFGAKAADAMRIQYGGSVKPGNAAELMACPDVDGALVGGASLVAEDFAGIILAAAATVSR